MLRKATPLDWVGDPFDATGFVALHGESTYQQFLEHYKEYTDVVGDHFLNLVATTLPTNAYLVTGEAKYRQWIVDYMDAWLARMQANGGIIPSFVDLDGRVGGAEGRWWGNAYGWGFSPVNPVTGQARGSQPHPAGARRLQQRAARDGRSQVRGRVADDDRRGERERTRDERTEGVPVDARRRRVVRVAAGAVARGRARSLVLVDARRRSRRASATIRGWRSWTARTTRYPEAALRRDLDSIPRRLAAMRADRTPPEKRLADNMLDYNPAATDALVRLMLGALVPGREGGLLNARLRYFDPVRKRAGVPEDVAALVSALGDRSHRRDARQRQPDDRAHGRRPGGRVRRAPDRVGRRERADGAGRRARRHRAARAGGRRDAHPRDATLRQHADGRLPLGSLT